MMAEGQISVIYAPQSLAVNSMESDGQPQICVVCGDTSDGPHFGALSCRACAAFFRRTVSLRLDYVCRADSDCPIEKSARNMCRSCRYQKCIRQGMLITAVQLPRDGIGKHSTPSRIRKEKNYMRKAVDTESSSSVRENERVTHKDDMPRAVARVPHTEVCSMSNTGDLELAYLCKMAEGYRHFLAIRRATQSLNEAGNVFKAFCSTGEPQLTNFDEAKRCCKMESHILTDIINDYFPPFDELPVPDKINIFKNFYSYFAYFVRAYTTYEVFGKTGDCEDRLLMHEGGYVKLSELEKFYENTVNCKADPQGAARIFLPTNRYILDVIVLHMKKIQISEPEFVALVGMLLWNDSLSFSRPEILERVWKTREIINTNLYRYYQAMGVVGLQAIQKVTNLMLILPKVQKAALDMNMNFKMAEIFNIFEADDCCKDFSLQ